MADQKVASQSERTLFDLEESSASPVDFRVLVERSVELLESLCRDFPIGYRPRLVWKNLRVSAGLARYQDQTIVLSAMILTDFERMEGTLKHEYAHLMAVARHGRKAANHGPFWQAAMRELGCEPVVRHSYEVQRNLPRQQVGYLCKKCGAMITRSKRLPRGRKYVHADCGGALKLESVAQVVWVKKGEQKGR